MVAMDMAQKTGQGRPLTGELPKVVDFGFLAMEQIDTGRDPTSDIRKL